MVFSITYDTVSTLYLGSCYKSKNRIDNVPNDVAVHFSATPSENVDFDSDTGDFSITANKVGKIEFIISVFFEKDKSGSGYKIPISIDVIEGEENILKYDYQTTYNYFMDIPVLKPTISLNKNESFIYCWVGAPYGLYLDPSTGSISGTPMSHGKYEITISAIDTSTNSCLCYTTLCFIVYSNDMLTHICEIAPGHDMIYSKKIALHLKCGFSGIPPSNEKAMQFSISCPAFSKSFLAKYETNNELYFMYIVDVSNRPGTYPITIEDTATGYFVTSDLTFIVIAACFNEDTTVLIMNNDEEEYKAIKDLEVGDKVVTYKHGIKKITHIGSRAMVNNPESVSDCMYKTTKSVDLSHDLILLGRHSILVDELTKTQKRKTVEIHPVDRIDDKCLLITMFNEDFEIVDDEKTYNYYHLVLEQEKDRVDRRYGIFVNGGNIIAATTYKKDFLKQF